MDREAKRTATVLKVLKTAPSTSRAPQSSKHQSSTKRDIESDSETSSQSGGDESSDFDPPPRKKTKPVMQASKRDNEEPQGRQTVRRNIIQTKAVRESGGVTNCECAGIHKLIMNFRHEMRDEFTQLRKEVDKVKKDLTRVRQAHNLDSIITFDPITLDEAKKGINSK